jgi:hypothetical protein
MLTRLRRDESGFALVTAVILLSVMALLMVVALSAGNSAFNLSERGARWSRTLGVAESGVNDAIGILTANRGASSPCAISTNNVCTPVEGQEGEYQVSWQSTSGGDLAITSIGYYPTRADATQVRKVRIELQPVPTFQYALFSESDLELKNNQDIAGDIFANNNVIVGNGAHVCGSIISSGGGVSMGTTAQVLKSYTLSSGYDCNGKLGNVWTGGSDGIALGNLIEGDAKASAGSTINCLSTSSYRITGGTVEGQATACGTITSSTPNFAKQERTSTEPPAAVSLPDFTFDPANYNPLTCYPSTGTCGESNTSATAVQQFAAVSRTNMTGTYAIWQTAPSQSTKIDLEGLSLGGDLTIVTNAPIDFGNANGGEIQTSVPGSTLVVVSLYPSPGACGTNGGDCAIYGKNKVEFDGGDVDDPNDGVAGVLYTPGKMAFKNQGNAAEGALYAGSMDIKNGFDIIYNSRIERILGFGTGLEQVLWQECPPNTATTTC